MAELMRCGHLQTLELVDLRDDGFSLLFGHLPCREVIGGWVNNAFHKRGTFVVLEVSLPSIPLHRHLQTTIEQVAPAGSEKLSGDATCCACKPGAPETYWGTTCFLKPCFRK